MYIEAQYQCVTVHHNAMPHMLNLNITSTALSRTKAESRTAPNPNPTFDFLGGCIL